MNKLILNILLLPIALSLTRSATSDSQVRKLANESIFTFEGTVTALNKSNVSGIPDPSKALVVRVDNVKMQTATAAKGFGSWLGKEITVVPEVNAAKPNDLKTGDRATFYTKPLLYGDNIAVAAIGIVKNTVGAGGHFAAAMAMAAEEKANEPLKKQLAEADAVVTGKVTKVRSLTESKAHALSMLTESKETHVSEHDPDWQEAVISVQAVEKGEPNQKEVVVVFPGSDDVMWASAPKYQKGDSGTWILHKNQIKDKQVANVLLTAEPEEASNPTSYTTLSEEDFQPADRGGKSQALIQKTIQAMKEGNP